MFKKNKIEDVGLGWKCFFAFTCEIVLLNEFFLLPLKHLLSTSQVVHSTSEIIYESAWWETFPQNKPKK